MSSGTSGRQGGRQTRWKDQDDPTDTGVPIDDDYVKADTRQESVTDAYASGAEAITDGGKELAWAKANDADRLDSRTYAAATYGTESTELDENPLETAWAMQGVQRTTLYADDTDGYGEPLPQTALDGTNLGARRKRLWRYNSGFGWNDYSDTGRVDMEARETREMTEAVASQCGLTDRQQKRAVQITLDMDGRRWNWAGGRPAMALGAIARSVAESAEKATERLTSESSDDPEAFEDVADTACRAGAERLIGFAFETEV